MRISRQFFLEWIMPSVVAVLLVAGIAASILSYTRGAIREEEFERLLMGFRMYDQDLCGSPLFFEEDGENWKVTCRGCARIDAAGLYPPAVIEEVRRWAIRGRLSFTEFLERVGDCPIPNAAEPVARPGARQERTL